MNLISHRGNLVPDGWWRSFGISLLPLSKEFGGVRIRRHRENTIEAIEQALLYCNKVEVDIRRIGERWYLGHDTPDYLVTEDFLLDNASKLLLHCKNLAALTTLSNYQYDSIEYFWHQEDNYTLTSNNHIIAYPGQPINEMCILMMPETNNYDTDTWDCWAVCTDHPFKYLGVENE